MGSDFGQAALASVDAKGRLQSGGIAEIDDGVDSK
jgi:hypothetical protein